ncbi:putative dolichyl pyrophosphate Glc1Man9GlcNAc2 alpha-1,3-glucosyltransferase [Phytophthora fragariae]|uniref:Alpha-1,3-glucosyltransferase n=2 Tax=Phytophthora fragariae TaxID=53985 RepID=A0A6A3QRW0_9STRA|nr:putative dolichyl pyrophosphate Glc1Man9GlcNAc2 alpha-1,3-glucosyltransferase [Phytophthora fragariae]KAE8921554.1 putative dolichyl pyrophosphate Glc1Man9GlcNAc2 alpha-1,3-glucosyltransferase [Phytophthora fragariae]KAE8970146.1 putative dolichyl pyrophosphate Glc1Man9GlcNAc2 alpha-1,3-glucosyltransferase [Phytophthora fragariae]KAE9068265.1 putative dolichyl pyrophosphate Glc1Man9GlcNAc2 alpha-1,3-glucosyltransferase [Phytophthora fragariae]KAE9069014.1 putative dolichyl pyrophosphate Glc1
MTMSRAELRRQKLRLDASLVAFFAFSVLLKLLLLPSYSSTDLEVHRNWLSLTHELPRRLWYHESTSQWTLDYPPFFAYFEYALSFAAAAVDRSMLVLSSVPVLSPSVLLFQRLSVISSDVVLFYALHAYCSSWPTVTTTEWAFSKTKRLAVMLVTVLDAGLLYVDHIHFQYNGMLLGLLILSATKFRLQQDLQGAFLYAVLLMFKHIYLYAAPLYFIYLLGHYCYVKKPDPGSSDDEDASRKLLRKRSISSTDVHETSQDLHDGNVVFSLVKFVRLGVMVLAVFAFAFGSILWDHEDPIAGMKQILSRLFPVQRGLCHAYWAPNVWALYAFLDKVLVILGFPAATEGVALMSGGLVQEASFAVLPSVSPLVCAFVTFAMMTPVLRSIWKYPDSSLFTSALAYCMLCSFLLGYHVHEKAILQVTLPMALMAADSVASMRLYRFASGVATISLFPLLFTPAEQGSKVLLGAGHALLAEVVLVPLLKQSLKERHIKVTAVRMTLFERVFLAGLAGLALLAAVFPYIPRIGSRYPFLPLMLISVGCAIGNIYVWGFTVTQHFRKLDAVKYYLDAQRPK